MEEIRQWDATTYGNHTKFEEKWGLVEDGKTADGTRCRKLTQKGIDFVLGKIEIPNEVYKKYGEDKWIPTSNSVQISYSDL